MQYRSCSSLNTDGYRAGYEVGTHLKSLNPEVILLFLSINYADSFADLFDGLGDGLDTVKPIIFGCTGDGIYETGNVQHHGIAALGMNSGGLMRWTVAQSKGVGADSYSAARSCAKDALSALGGAPSFAFVLADGIQSDGTQLVAGLTSVLSIPYFGGLAGDDRKFGQSFVLINNEAVEDTAAILLGAGKINFQINAASGWTPVGDMGVVEVSHRNVVDRISGMTAYAFMCAQIGKSPGVTDVGIIPLATTQKDDDMNYPALRSVWHFNPTTGSATLGGSIEVGAKVRVCAATHGEVLNGVDTALSSMKRTKFVPKAALVVSCAGRKWVLGSGGNQEVEKLFSALGTEIPMIGFPSFGEISPFIRPDGTYTPSFFHNVTFSLCLLGE